MAKSSDGQLNVIAPGSTMQDAAQELHGKVFDTNDNSVADTLVTETEQGDKLIYTYTDENGIIDHYLEVNNEGNLSGYKLNEDNSNWIPAEFN